MAIASAPSHFSDRKRKVSEQSNAIRKRAMPSGKGRRRIGKAIISRSTDRKFDRNNPSNGKLARLSKKMLQIPLAVLF
jgi:hypothetical protein